MNTGYKKVSTGELINLLEATISELKRDGSYEGRIEYTCLVEDLDQGEFLVKAYVRTGNDEGQGGCILIEGNSTITEPH